MRITDNAEMLRQVWELVKPLDDSGDHGLVVVHHEEEYRAVVYRVRKLLKPYFAPSAEDRVSQLEDENAALRERVRHLEENSRPPMDAIDAAHEHKVPRTGGG
jgi:hypothetical protein